MVTTGLAESNDMILLGSDVDVDSVYIAFHVGLGLVSK